MRKEDEEPYVLKAYQRPKVSAFELNVWYRCDCGWETKYGYDIKFCTKCGRPVVFEEYCPWEDE